MYLFAGGFLSSTNMNRTEWDKWALPAKLEDKYYPHLGEATVTVSDASGNAIQGAAVLVTYSGGAFVTRKLSDESGKIKFGGWSGKAAPVPHTVTVTMDGFRAGTTTVQIQPQGTVSASVQLHKERLPAGKDPGSSDSGTRWVSWWYAPASMEDGREPSSKWRKSGDGKCSRSLCVRFLEAQRKRLQSTQPSLC